LHIDRRLPPPVSEEWDWQLFAACRGMDVEMFFHPLAEGRKDRTRRIAQAKVICHTCPVMTECRQHALTTREPYGIWGGLSEDERALLLGVQQLRHPAARQPHRRPVPNGEDRLREDGRSLVSQIRDPPGSAHLS
jgi:WhiB family redox-sensing transcriptional regulator